MASYGARLYYETPYNPLPNISNIALVPSNQNMVFTYPNANEIKMNLWNSVRFPIVIFAAAAYHTGLPLKLDMFATSVYFVAMAVLPLVGIHVGEIISKAIINMVVYILGALFGYGLRRFNEHEIGIVFVLPVIFILIAVGIFGRSVIKMLNDGYDYAPMQFLLAMFLALVYPLGPDWLTNEFDRNIKTLGIAHVFTIVSVWLLPFFSGDEVHYRVQENIHILADIFNKDLNVECFGLSQNLQDKLFLHNLQSLINSKEKETSLTKFLSWELRWHPHPQEQYEKIGDLIRHCASNTLSLLTNLENLQLSPDLQEKCKEIWSKLGKALTLLYDSMKHKTAPARLIYIHLTRVQDLANHLKKSTLELAAALKLTLHPDNTLKLTAPVLKLALHTENKVELTNAVLNLASHQENTVELTAALRLTSYQEDIHITSHLLEYVKTIEKLASSINELAALVPFKQSEQNSNVPKLLTGWESPQRFIPGIQEVATKANQLIVAPMNNMASRLKLIINFSPVSDGPDTTQPHVNLV